MDSQSSNYNRQVMGFLTYLGNLGGFFATISAIGSYIIFFFIHRMYLASLIKDTYMVKRKNRFRRHTAKIILEENNRKSSNLPT